MKNINLPKNVEVSLRSLLPLLVLTFLIMFTFRFGVGNIVSTAEKVKTAKNELNTLQAKLNLLNQVSGDSLATSSLATNSLPAENPALTLVSQVKKIASQNGLVLLAFKSKDTGESPASAVSSSEVSFEIEGPRPLIVNFMTAITQISPISYISRAKLTETEGLTNATINIKSFWAPYPKELPAIESEIGDLTPEERGILTGISGLTQPSFVELPAAQPGGNTTNPFGL